MKRPNLLVICGKNKRRSRTAEFIFKNDHRFNIRSAGLSPKSNRRLTETDLLWADLTLVMETEHRARLKGQFNVGSQPLEVLYIPDEYEFMNEELIEMLQTKINSLLQQYFGI